MPRLIEAYYAVMCLVYVPGRPKEVEGRLEGRGGRRKGEVGLHYVHNSSVHNSPASPASYFSSGYC